MINIAICGRTNSGKTSLISTIRDKESGIISDSSNTTKQVAKFTHEILDIQFYDFPGFEKTGNVEAFLKLVKEKPSMKECFYTTILSDEYSKRDYDNLQNLKEVDVILFICDSQTVPDASHLSELNLLREVNTNIVGIITKVTNLELNNNNYKLNRKDSWISFLHSNGITDVIDFNSHIDNKLKIIDIMNTVGKYVINTERRKTFLSNVKKLNDKYTDDTKKSSLAFHQLILGLDNLKVDNKGVNISNNTSSLFQYRVKALFDKYLKNLKEIYQISFEDLDDHYNISNYNHDGYLYRNRDKEYGDVGMSIGYFSIATPLAFINPLLGIGLGMAGLFAGRVAGSAIASEKDKNTVTYITVNAELRYQIAKRAVCLYLISSRLGYSKKVEIEHDRKKIDNYDYINVLEEKIGLLDNETIIYKKYEEWFLSAINCF
ncbi:GTPase domain-containing protein [Chondrinema litorale]|uniref:GTPase domain-containing protein n=1 Tax=Chondrinema litorale TaxID=2994555 RepID=UPI002543303E|nr:GTPase domain-containing protein [Chondrinema litorale]UZS00046.1 GTPase domain-containing protein [Chondrinema litorale]